MARIIKEEAYAERRKAILNVARQLVITRGYEQMTIQDMLDALQISKGAFYHYFDSKQMLLEALIEGMQEEALQILVPILHDPQLVALAKLQRFFDAASRWKTAQKTFVLALWSVWYTDDNAIVRQKLRASMVKRIGPLLTELIQQGVQEGTFTAIFPEQVGGVILSLILDLSDAIAELLLLVGVEHDGLPHIILTVAVYTDALERVLGAPKGSLLIVDNETLKEWVDAICQETVSREAT
jgi:AcrR family transcriptional regulator